MKKIILPENGITIKIDPDKASGVEISLNQLPQATNPEKKIFWMDVIHKDGDTRHDTFDHFWEALDSLTGIIKTLEKEIETKCSSSSES